MLAQRTQVSMTVDEYLALEPKWMTAATSLPTTRPWPRVRSTCWFNPGAGRSSASGALDPDCGSTSATTPAWRLRWRASASVALLPRSIGARRCEASVADRRLVREVDRGHSYGQ